MLRISVRATNALAAIWLQRGIAETGAQKTGRRAV
jgi:hypothetical protein